MTIEQKVEDEYKIVITINFQSGQPTSWFKSVITTSVPEDGMSFSTASQWDAPLEAGGESLNTLSQLLGTGQSNQLKIFQKNIWQGSDPLEISLDLNFVTHSDPVHDVVRPALSLALLPLPEAETDQGEERWTLRPPVVRGQDAISVRTRGMSFPFVLPLNVDVDFNSTMCTSPSSQFTWPVSANVSFSFLASEAPTREDFGLNLNSIQGGDQDGLSANELLGLE